jgi:hypothetical protein
MHVESSITVSIGKSGLGGGEAKSIMDLAAASFF